jgi:methyl-accepting chemotaxis protein
LIGRSVETVDAGALLVGEAGATMAGLVESVKQVAEIMSAISAASSEQSSGIEQVNQTIISIDDVTQQNAALDYGADQSWPANTSETRRAD